MSRGDGRVYLRGKIWYIEYYALGENRRESSGSMSREDAERLLKLRVNVARRPGYVYLIWDGEFLKIGMSASDPNKRLREMQTGSPRTLELIGFIASKNCASVERSLHERFNALHVRGEWFEDHADIRRAFGASRLQMVV